MFMAEDFINYPCQTQDADGGWYMARPLGMDSFSRRLKEAYLVLTGKLDTVTFKENNSEVYKFINGR